MNDPEESKFDSLRERAWDASSEAQRATWRDEVAALAPTQRAEMETLMHDADRLRSSIGKDAALSARLHEKLLAIPTNIPNDRWWTRVARAPVGWQHIAACLLIGLGIALYAYWPEAKIESLDGRVASHIASLAATYHGSATPLDLASSDRAAVEAALAAKHLPFTPQVMTPTKPVTLVGGGVVTFEGRPAAFTRWTNDQQRTFTLYQFEPKPLGMPKAFLKTVATTSPGVRVLMWPGTDGLCGWALVLEGDAKNPFGYHY